MFLNKLKNFSNNCANRLFVYLIQFYRLGFKPYFKKTPTCRFDPSCSAYALDCYKEKNFFEASKLAFLRLIKCHPFGGYGYDPLVISKGQKNEH